MEVFSVCGVKQNLYVFGLHRYPDLDERIFNFLLAEDICASFLFVGNLNGHHQK